MVGGVNAYWPNETGNNVRNIFTMNSICYTIEHTRFQIQISILKKEQRVGSPPREFQIWNALYSDFVFLIRIQLLFSITVGRRSVAIVLVFKVTYFMLMLHCFQNLNKPSYFTMQPSNVQ
jgi:hypothetical protein